jgi:glutaconyl-CoA decarboxylase
VNFMLALNVTIYGLGLVFLALLVLMVAIMLLTKVFAMATGKDLLATPGLASSEAPRPAPAAPSPAAVAEAPPPTATGVAEAAEAVTAPLPGKILSVTVKAGDRVQRGDELCVIEAMKMGNSVKAPRDGFIAEVCVAPGDSVGFGAPLVLLASTIAAAAVPRPSAPPQVAAAPPPAAVESSVFTLTVAGTPHKVEITAAASGVATVRLDGSSHRAQRDPQDGKKILVNGQPHTVEVKEIAGNGATVLIDGVPQKVEIARATAAAFSLAYGGKQHAVEVKGAADSTATVVLNGSTFQAERDKGDPTRILVNGQPHTVEVKEIAGNAATVLIDGRVEKLGIARATAAAPAAPAPTAPAAAAPAAAVPTPAPATGELVTAPLPGKILSVMVKVGDRVQRGDELCVIEAMKMGNSIRAQRVGTVREILVSPGQSVAFGAPLLLLD